MDEIGLFEAIHTARAQRRFRPDPVRCRGRSLPQRQ
jgi:hypothetical protein